MSRLYLKVNSDARKNLITSRGHTMIEGTIYWGSVEYSKVALDFSVVWFKSDEKPVVTVTKGEGL